MSYDQISGTAKTIAFLRAIKEIPFGIAIADLCDAENATREFYRRPDFEVDLERMAKMAHWAKLRFFALQKAVELTEVKNILELASGLSPAGLIWARDPNVRYLETDLLNMIAEKEKVAAAIVGPLRANLCFAVLNALDGGLMKGLADQLFDGGPITIIHEGLFPYLTHKEKLVVAKNIAAVLAKHGGAWITTDISLKQNFEHAFQISDYSRKLQSVLNKATGRDMVELAFTSFDEAEDLFQSAGFSVERHTQLELVPGLLTTEELGRSKNLAFQQVWTMRLK